jgi:hypothetical protein
LSGPRMHGGLAEDSGRKAGCLQERETLRRDRETAVTLWTVEGQPRSTRRAEVGEFDGASRTSGGQGSRPAQAAEKNRFSRGEDSEAPGACGSGNRSWRAQVQGRRSGRKARAAAGGENALEKDPVRSSAARKSGGRGAGARASRPRSLETAERSGREGGGRVNPTSVGRDETSPAR